MKSDNTNTIRAIITVAAGIAALLLVIAMPGDVGLEFMDVAISLKLIAVMLFVLGVISGYFAGLARSRERDEAET